MSRLTEKVNYGSSWVETIETDEYIPLNYSTDTMTGKCIDKLGKLEDLEEELGCPLEKFLTTNEIYSDLEDGTIKKYKIIGINFCEKKIYFWMSFVPMNVDFTDYKKYYWLKEDKSE